MELLILHKLNRLLDKHIRQVWAPKTKTVIQAKQREVTIRLEEIGSWFRVISFTYIC